MPWYPDRELNQLRGDYESLTDSSHQQDFAYRHFLDQLSVPSLRVQVLAEADDGMDAGLK